MSALQHLCWTSDMEFPSNHVNMHMAAVDGVAVAEARKGLGITQDAGCAGALNAEVHGLACQVTAAADAAHIPVVLCAAETAGDNGGAAKVFADAVGIFQ